MLIGGNWLLFIWSVNNHHMLEASLGYFINPLVNILLGMIFLGERFRRMQWVAVALAICGVLVQLWTFGSLPIIALGLALASPSMAWCVKKLPSMPRPACCSRRGWLLPVAAIYLFGIADSATSHIGRKSVVAEPAADCRRRGDHYPIAVLYRGGDPPASVNAGFLQYIGPTLMFLLAVTFYGEVQGADKMVTFPLSGWRWRYS
ncbi:EamA family transporter RarD [Shigella flexneri]